MLPQSACMTCQGPHFVNGGDQCKLASSFPFESSGRLLASCFITGHKDVKQIGVGVNKMDSDIAGSKHTKLVDVSPWVLSLGMLRGMKDECRPCPSGRSGQTSVNASECRRRLFARLVATVH